MTEYHRPPDDYQPPTRCEQCHEVIFYGPVIGGHKWMRIASAVHVVAMRPEGWWDTGTGEWRSGINSQALDDALAETARR